MLKDNLSKLLDKFLDQLDLFLVTQVRLLLKQISSFMWGFMPGFLLSIAVIFAIHFLVPTEVSVWNMFRVIFGSVYSVSILYGAFTVTIVGFLLQTELKYVHRKPKGRPEIYYGIHSNRLIWIGFLIVMAVFFYAVGVPLFLFPIALASQAVAFFPKGKDNWGKHIFLPMVNGILLFWGFVVVSHYMILYLQPFL